MTAAATSGPTRAEIFVDPMCPWAWLTSRWLLEASQVRDLQITWSVMSLSVLNEGRDLPEDYRAMLERAWLPARVLVAAALDDPERAQEVTRALYDAMGERKHPQGRGDDADGLRELVAEALAECSLPAGLVDRGENVPGDEVDTALRASTARALAMVGDDVGTPVVAVEGTAFFGPVVTPAPRGEAAGRLWDGCVLVAGTAGFYELKRSRSSGPEFS